MAFRKPHHKVLRRARAPEDKEKIREAFIAAGRRLFSRAEPEQVSLRAIAAEAGYAPSAVYQYFANQQDLFFHVRSHDMGAATQILRRKIARIRDPSRRVEKLCLETTDYWLAHMAEFMIVFAPPTARRPDPKQGPVPFARSAAVSEALKLYYDTVDNFFRTLAKPPMSSHKAADLLMAALHGTIVFPHMTRAMPWTDTRFMVRNLVRMLLRGWKKTGV